MLEDCSMQRPVDRVSVSHVAVHNSRLLADRRRDLEPTVAVCMTMSVRYDGADRYGCR